jgi:hypothetical protein
MRSVWQTDAADRHAVIQLTGFSTGDTADLVLWFSAVKLAILASATGQKAGTQTVAGTLVTLSTTGLSGDSGYLLCWGAIAPPP